MTQGIHAHVLRDGHQAEQILLIGAGIPRIHHADRVPVYLVLEHRRGTPIKCIDGKIRRLLVYPSGATKPGRPTGLYVYAHHERLAFDAPLPLFDQAGLYQ